jgi:hypothetical protein
MGEMRNAYKIWLDSLGVKQLGCETDHSPPSSTKVKNEWSYTSTPQYVFMAWCLVKHMDFTFLYLYLTPEGKIPLRRPSYRWEYVRMYLKDMVRRCRLDSCG